MKAKYLASYLIGFNPPVTLMNTSTSANKVTFTQTRAHKYLSARTQRVDIFLRTLLYGISQLQFLHDDKEMGCCSWHSGLGGPLCLPCWGEDCFVIETYTYIFYTSKTQGNTLEISNKPQINGCIYFFCVNSLKARHKTPLIFHKEICFIKTDFFACQGARKFYCILYNMQIYESYN